MSEPLNIEQVCMTALEFFGEKSQVIATVEELNELGVELCKVANGKSDPKMLGVRTRIIDEMADVALMMQQMAITLGITNEEIENQIQFKANKLMGRIQRMQYLRTNPGAEL